MDPFTLAIGGIISGIGLLTSADAEKDQEKAQKQQAQVQQQIADEQYEASAAISTQTRAQERLRLRQAQLNYQRERRANIRQVMLARATGLVASQSAGGLFSSGIQGVKGQIIRQGIENERNLAQNYTLGQRAFDINQRIFDIQNQSNQVLSGLGANVARTQESIFKAQAQGSVGQAITNFGGTVLNNSDKISSVFGS